MQKDMHYYAIYFLGIAAGLPPDDAYKIAYSSQYVDNSKIGRTTKLIEKNGKTDDFQPIRTAHNGFESMEEGVQFKIYYPFHFLPGMTGEQYEEMAVTKAGITGKLFQDILNAAIQTNNLFRIGISLHVLADTFSHENFSGLWSLINNIKKPSFVPFRKSWIAAVWHKARWKFRIYKLAPAIGHGRAGHLPDIPYMSWSCMRYPSEFCMISNNLKFLYGMSYLYREVFLKIAGDSPHILSIEEVNGILWKGIFKCGRLKKRCKYWMKEIKKIQKSKKLSIPNEHLKYKKNRWIKEIGKWRHKFLFIQKSKIILSITKKEFEESNFRQFHKHAWEHRIFIGNILKKRLVFAETTEGKYLLQSVDSIIQESKVKHKSV